jgi:hypothetical protein
MIHMFMYAESSPLLASSLFFKNKIKSLSAIFVRDCVCASVQPSLVMSEDLFKLRDFAIVNNARDEEKIDKIRINILGNAGGERKSN